MIGTVVHCTNLDSVRIEILGGSRALTIPASLLLAADCVMRYALLKDDSLVVEPVEDGEGGKSFWEANVGNLIGQGDSPWGAVQELADKIEASK